MSQNGTMIKVDHVTKSYRRDSIEIPVLRDISIDVPAGEFLALMGPSGSGKTTLLNLIAGIDRATSGTVRVAGTDLTPLSEGELAKWRSQNVGFIFQFYNLIPSLTARENVALITEIASEPLPPEVALEMVNLGGRLDHFPAQLSGGEQQRVAIARAIAKRPQVLLCDEPTGALDVRTGIVVLEAIQRVNKELGALTVIITHNAVMADMADRVIFLSDGRVHQVQVNERKVPASSLRW